MKLSITCRRTFICLIILLLVSCFSININAQYYHDNKDNIYVHKTNDENRISLTFDDGPHPKKTKEILEVLKKHNVKATFFMIGENALQYPEIVQMVAAEGHEIANHTYNHKSLYVQDKTKLIENVKKCSNTLENITGIAPKLFRPPEGYMNDDIAQTMNSEGYDVILWKIDTYDWKGKSSIDIYNTVVSSVKSGDIILMHDYIWKKSNTAQALDRIIPQLKDEGYCFVTVSELISQ